MMAAKKKYAQVGLGGRSWMFTEAVTKKFADQCEMVGLCDSNEGRVNLCKKMVRELENGYEVPGYAHTDFEKMIAETKPDTVIVTTMDSTHHEYIIRAMELGCNVITEKPMTIGESQCQRIIDTQKATGKQCRVTFNYRYAPPRTQVKDLLMNGTIGEVLSVDFHWMLNTYHGADYYRRWHRDKANSGGLLVHKSTHHFDLVNWWVSGIPQEVFAQGDRKFYTPQTGDRLGLTNRGERCHTCPQKKECAFELSLEKNEDLKARYLDNEVYDGYYRDRCVFGEGINIEDTMNVLVDYDNGVKLCYSLNSFCGWEGYRVAFNGTKGRIEHDCMENVYVNGDGTVPGALDKEGTNIKIYPLRGPAYQVDIWTGTGGHGGGDDPLLEDIFTNAPADKHKRAADSRSGAYSILCGVAGNKSMAENRPVRIDELVQGIDRPDYTTMPDGSEPLEMPLKDIFAAMKQEKEKAKATSEV